MAQYIGLIHKEAESDFGVSFPDFPGVVTASSTMDKARTLAEEALAFHVEGMIADGEAVPAPASFEAIMADRENRDGVAILVELKTVASRVVRVNVTFPEDVLAAIDRFAEAHGYTRSGFLASAAKQVMRSEAT